MSREISSRTLVILPLILLTLTACGAQDAQNPITAQTKQVTTTAAPSSTGSATAAPTSITATAAPTGTVAVQEMVKPDKANKAQTVQVPVALWNWIWAWLQTWLPVQPPAPPTPVVPIPTAPVIPTPTPATAPPTTPPTTPAALEPVVVRIGTQAVAVPPSPTDTIKTRSGDWTLHHLGSGSLPDLQFYLVRVSSNPGFARIFACRRAFTHEAGDGTALNLTQTTVTLQVGAATAQTWNMALAQGSCRIVQNQEPVVPRPEWLRAAVQTENRLPAYRREHAWTPGILKPLAPDRGRGTYDPTSLGPNLDGTTPTSSNNYVGTTSGQGGEYTASRGFIHNVDAGMVDLALHNEDTAISAAWNQFVQYTWYSLAQPQAAVWSSRIHNTVDPQFPQAGETAWEIGGVAGAVNPEIQTIKQVDSWSRDPAHLENTGYVHWILTEDPWAALVLQRQLAYALGSYYEYRRVPQTVKYKGFDEQERGVYNTLSALWKVRDIVMRTRSEKGTMIWDQARVLKQTADVMEYYDTQFYQPMKAAQPGTSTDYARQLTHAGLASTFVEPMNTPQGVVNMTAVPTFFIPQYGKEPMYLWAKSGDAKNLAWLRSAALHTAARLTYVGGRAGVDGCTGVRGSSLPIKVDGTTPTWTTAEGWATWLKTQCPTVDTLTFNGAYVHTTLQMGNTLKLARDAGITGLDQAITVYEQTKSRTTSIYAPDLEMHKHLATAP